LNSRGCARDNRFESDTGRSDDTAGVDQKAEATIRRLFSLGRASFHGPTQVLNGRGTQLYGHRFAPVGTRGVYLADSDAGASAEVLARKKRLGGASQISLDKYPRVVFAVDVELERVVSLVRKSRNSALAAIHNACLANDLSYSQNVGRFLAESGVQGLLYKSLVGPGLNLLVFLENCGSRELKIRNLAETMGALRQIL
jgi:RES domain-containing protein